MNRISERANLIMIKVKSLLIIFFIGLFILSSCPLRQTINSFLNTAEAKAGKDLNSGSKLRTVHNTNAVEGCASRLKTNYDAVTSSIQSPDLKTPVFVLAAFAIAFHFLRIFYPRTSLTNAFGKNALVPAYATHVKNCLFRI